MHDQGNLDVAKRAATVVSRRSINMGAAWSVPIILGAVAAPAATGSAGPIIGAGLVAEKEPAHQFEIKRIDFALTLANTGDGPGSVQVLSVISSATTGTMVGLPTTVIVPAPGSVVVRFSYTYEGNAGTATYTVAYTVDDGAVEYAMVEITVRA